MFGIFKLAKPRAAVSPVLATLLLIAIAVATGILVYVFTTNLWSAFK